MACVELALVHQTPTSLPTPLIEQPETVVLLPTRRPCFPAYECPVANNTEQRVQ